MISADPLARWIAYGVWVAWAATELTTLRGPRAGDVVRDSGTRLLFVFGMVPSIVAAWVIAQRLSEFAIPGNPWFTFAAGCAVSLCGVALRRWSIAVLGRFFTRDVMIREGHTVVSRGPYRLLRHPSYTGLMLGILGYALMLENWLSIVVVAVGFCVAVLPRIHHEEKVLEAGLGTPYRAFEKTRKRLIPLVW